MGNLELKFRTFDDLLNDVLVDLRVLDEEGLIEPSQLIKVAQRVNYDLGLRIHQNKETIIDINNFIAKLPEDFYVLNGAMLTTHERCTTPITWAGRTTENVFLSGNTSCEVPLTYDINQLNPNKTYDNACGVSDSYDNPINTCTPEQDPWFQRSCYSVCENGTNNVKVILKKNHHTYEYSSFERLYILPQTYLDPNSMNSKCTARHTAQIKNGFLYTSVKHGKVYISYQGSLEDEDGNLLVLDHPEINFYYIAAMMEYVFKIMYYSLGEEVAQKYQAAKLEAREARAKALSIVNTPNFEEMQQVFRKNREAQYQKYYRTFQTDAFRQYYHSLPF